MSNEEMVANRFGRWAKSRKLIKDIQNTLRAGGYVVMGGYEGSRQYDERHVDMFKATKSGAYVQRGKKWLCIDGMGFRFFRPVVKAVSNDVELILSNRDF